MSALDQITDPEQRRRYTDQLITVFRDAFAVQGICCFESTRRAAALHEAGHGVVYVITADSVRWWPPSRLRIWRKALPENLSGLTVWSGRTDVSPKAPPIHVLPHDCTGTITYALRALAGVVSEQLFDGADFRLASSVDELLVAGGCARNLATLHWHCEPEQALMVLLNGTAAMLQANAGIVLTLADALEQRRKLQGRDLATLLRKVRKQPPP